MIKIFISYGHDDYAYLAKKLRDRIDDVTEENGEKKFDVFLDDKLTLGTDWSYKIEKAIEETHYMICFISKHSTGEKGWCRKEINYALETGGITIIPVRLEETRVPFGISELQRIEWLNNPEGFEDRLKEILAVISVPPPAKNAAAEAEKEDRTPEFEHLHKTCWYFLNKGSGARDTANNTEDFKSIKEKYLTALIIARQGIEEEDGYTSRRDLSVSLYRTGIAFFRENNISEAKKYYSEALEVSRKNVKDYPSYESRREFSVSLNKMGDIADKEDNIQETKKYYSEALEIRRQNAEDFPSYESRRDLSVSLNRMGDIAVKEDNIQEAKKYYSECLENLRQNAEDFPSYESRRDLSVSYYKLALLEIEDKNYAAAKEYCEKSLPLDKQNLDTFPCNESRNDYNCTKNLLNRINRLLQSQ